MYPILFQIEPFTIFGYDFGPWSLFSHGILAAVGFFIAMSWFLKMAQKKHFHLEFIADHFLSLALVALVGARLGYIYVFFSQYAENLLSILAFWDGGYLLWTGIMGFLIAFLFICEKQKERMGQWLDVLVPAAVIALIFDAFGAFLGGNQYGSPTELPWGIIFDNPEIRYTVPIHPVQLYLVLFLLILLIILQVLHKKMLRDSLIGLIGLSLLAFFFYLSEYFRGDEMITAFGMRLTQVLELSVFFACLFFIFWKKKKHV